MIYTCWLKNRKCTIQKQYTEGVTSIQQQKMVQLVTGAGSLADTLEVLSLGNNPIGDVGRCRWTKACRGVGSKWYYQYQETNPSGLQGVPMKLVYSECLVWQTLEQQCWCRKDGRCSNEELNTSCPWFGKEQYNRERDRKYGQCNQKEQITPS